RGARRAPPPPPGERLLFVFPEVPAIGETIPGYDVTLYYGVSAPKGTPPDVIAVLNKAINAALADPAMKERIAGFGGVVRGCDKGDKCGARRPCHEGAHRGLRRRAARGDAGGFRQARRRRDGEM